MDVIPASADEKQKWNRFVREHYPPVGAFMQTWEWGAFQQALGRRIERYFLKKGGQSLAALTLVRHSLPLGFSYAYAPRGPVISRAVPEAGYAEIFDVLRRWAPEKFRGSVFVRLEPPVSALTGAGERNGFVVPPYYVQPRFNLAVPLDAPEEEIMGGFHPSTRSNVRRAQRRGVEVSMKSDFSESDMAQFFAMAKDTIRRNSGKNAYPSPTYFRSFFEAIPIAGAAHDPENMRVGVFCGYKNNEPAGTHFVLFFGDTATYLYGASYSNYLSSKVSTSLHWAAMREAKHRGTAYYDLGGIDETLWPTLTDFKRQFRGKEFRYVGNVDIPVRPALYRLYNAVRRWNKFL